MPYDALLTSLLSAVDAAPGDVPLRLHVAELLADRGRLPEALTHCTQARSPDANPAAPALRQRLTSAISTPEPPAFDWMSAEEQVADIPELARVEEPAPNPTIEDIERPTATLADVGGMEQVKERLELAFLGPMRNPQLAKAFGKTLAGGLLLYGPPGCGKTFLARAVAGELGARFYGVGLHDVLDMWLGKSEQNLHGVFETARRHTPSVLFLDEVGEMTLGTQKKLLRVLQEREFERVGGTAPVKVDVRVIAATNRNLRDEVGSGRFREDLYYRLNVIAIHMPPLRERMEDIPALVNHFLDKHRYSPASPPTRITEEAMNQLMTHTWPGNVRELENIIQRAVVLSRGNIITPEHITFSNELNRYVLDVEQKVRASTPLEDMLRHVKREAILTALRLNEHDFARAAQQLSLSEDALRQYLMELKLLGEGEAVLSHEYLPRLRDDRAP